MLDGFSLIRHYIYISHLAACGFYGIGKFENFYFDVKKENFAWIGDTGLERKMVNVMKKGSRIMITGYNQSGSQTIDHYSLMGFTKAYNTAKKSCA